MKNIKSNVGSFAITKLQAKRRSLLAILAITLVFGIAVVGCDNGTTGGGVLPAPTGLSVTVSGTTINATWNAVSGASGYTLYVGVNSSFSPVETANCLSTSYTENDCPAGTFYFKVAAYNASGTGAMSNVVTVTVSGTNLSLNGTWECYDHIITINGNTGVFTYIPTADAKYTDALNKNFIQIGGQYLRNLTSTDNVTWSGQVLYITYNQSSPTVATGTTWVNTTLTMSTDGNTLQTHDGLTWTRRNYSLNGVWECSGHIITINGSTGVFNYIPTADAKYTDALNKGYIQIGGQYLRNLTSTGILTWSGQVLYVTYNQSSPTVATGTNWVNTTLTMSTDGNTLQTDDDLTWTRQ